MEPEEEFYGADFYEKRMKSRKIIEEYLKKRNMIQRKICQISFPEIL